MRVILSNPPRTKSGKADVESYPNSGILALIAFARQFMPDVELIYCILVFEGSNQAQ